MTLERLPVSLEMLAAEMRGSSAPTDERLDEWAAAIEAFAAAIPKSRARGQTYDCGEKRPLSAKQIAERVGISLQAVHCRLAAGATGPSLLTPRYAYSRKRPAA